MSPHAVNTFVSDLVHMAQAMERLPQVEKELVEALDQVAIKENYIQHLQMRSIDAANEISDLRTQVKAMEGQRDDAELRFLLADDRAQHAIKALRDVAGSLGVTISVIDPTPVTVGPSADPLPLGETTSDTPTSGSVSTATLPPIELEVTPDGEVRLPSADPTADTHGSSNPIDPPVSSDNVTTADVSTTSTEGSVPSHPTIPSADPVPSPSGVSSQGEGSEQGVSVSGDPTDSALGHGATATTGTNALSDPEPMPRYTWAWYQWRDRTIEDRVKDGLPAVSSASHYS